MVEKVEKAEKQERVLAENEVRLSDGRIVEMRELTGEDQMRITDIIASDKNATTNYVAFSLKTQQISMLHSIVKINGIPVDRPFTVKECLTLMGKFLQRDTKILMEKYAEISTGETSTSE